MEQTSLYLIQEVKPFTPKIGTLVSMMNYVRHTTLQTVEGLTVEQLDYLHDENSNSIGALLRHMTAVEVAYQLRSFENRSFTDAEKEIWGAGMELGDLGRAKIKGHTLEEYVQTLSEVRAKTLEEFAKRDDAWLQEPLQLQNGICWNRYWMWFHVFEDEINHRGQMRWLRKRVPQLQV